MQAITERVLLRFAQLSDEQKDEAVQQVMTNLEAKKKDSKGKSKSKSKSKGKSKKTKKKEEESPKEKQSESEESVDVSEMSDDSDDNLMNSIESLSQEIENIKEDGKVERSEVTALFGQMMEMVSQLLRAKPGRRPRKSSLGDRVACAYLVEAARGQQNQRKNKDLMDDTGGRSKGREREPEQKPPRDDSKNRYRKKDKPAEDRDKDTDNDKDLKAAVHPLDRKTEAIPGLVGPEDNYYRKVWSALVSVIASSKDVSEKDFSSYDSIMSDTDKLLRTADAMEMVDRFESNDQRPEFCAEYLFPRIELSEG